MPTPTFLTSFAGHVRDTPNAPALTWADREIDYASLDALARAATLPDLAPGAPVCVPAHKDPETIALLIACFRADRRVLLPSASLGPDALLRLCEQVGCTHVLTRDGAQTTGATSGNLPGTGLLLTTSGSTGTPKVVVLSESGVDSFADWAVRTFDIRPGVGVLNHAPLNFDLCLLDVWASLAAGARVDLVDPTRATDGGYLAALCAARAPAVIQAVPLFFRLVTDTGQVFPNVRDVLLTGDVVPQALLTRLPEAFPAARFWNVYGCTETNDSFLHRVNPTEYPLPIGTPITGVEVQILDEDGTPTDAGELVVRTPFRANGYFDPELDRQRWQDGWFRTGDLVRRDATGLFHLTGRNDHQVKVRGVRTNVQEVEQVVLDHPDVLEAAVVAIPDEEAGNVLHAIVRPTPDSTLNGLHLRLHCATHLPRTAIPGAFDLRVTALPRTSTGKVDRTALRTAITENVREEV